MTKRVKVYNTYTDSGADKRITFEYTLLSEFEGWKYLISTKASVAEKKTFFR